MRNSRRLVISLLFFVMLLAACEPLPAVNPTAMAPATPSPPVASMRETNPPDTLAPTNEPETQPAGSEPATQEPIMNTTPSPEPEPVGFEGMVSSGLAARWPGRQAIVVVADGETATGAALWLYERIGDGWKAVEGPWPAMVGKNGVSKQKEGDGRAPSGAFSLGTAFGWAQKPNGVSYQYRLLDRSDRWIDDSQSPFYNRWVRGSASKCGSGEDLKEIDQYKHALVVHYNDEAVPGDGSAIFLHVWRGPGEPTHGCTAISENHMVELLGWLNYAARPILVQGTAEQIRRLMAEDWGMSCLPKGWGFLDDFIPDAQLEIRYNTDDNFTGRRLDGYHSSQAPMRMEAIEALSLAAADLRSDRYGLRVYDAYRPQQASDAMIIWAEDEADTATKGQYYPDINKADIPGQYVAKKSNHRLGGTVDLTVFSWRTAKNLDMGGPFDFFGAVSAYRYKGLTDAQAANRALLRSTLAKVGFNPYDKEWWHFTYPVTDTGDHFPILPREYVLR